MMLTIFAMTHSQEVLYEELLFLTMKKSELETILQTSRYSMVII